MSNSDCLAVESIGTLGPFLLVWAGGIDSNYVPAPCCCDFFCSSSTCNRLYQAAVGQFQHCPLFTQRLDKAKATMKKKSLPFFSSTTERRSKRMRYLITLYEEFSKKDGNCHEAAEQMIHYAVRHLCQHGCYVRAYAPSREWHSLRTKLYHQNKRATKESIASILKGWRCVLRPPLIKHEPNGSHDGTLDSCDNHETSSSKKDTVASASKKFQPEKKELVSMKKKRSPPRRRGRKRERKPRKKKSSKKKKECLVQIMFIGPDGKQYESATKVVQYLTGGKTKKKPRRSPPKKKSRSNKSKLSSSMHTESPTSLVEGKIVSASESCCGTCANDDLRLTFPSTQSLSPKSNGVFDEGTCPLSHEAQTNHFSTTWKRKRKESMIGTDGPLFGCDFYLSPFGLLEELLRSDTWILLLSTIMLNKTSRAQVDTVLCSFLNRWPDARSAAEANPDEVLEVITSLGLHKRAETIVKFSKDYLELVEKKKKSQVPELAISKYFPKQKPSYQIIPSATGPDKDAGAPCTSSQIKQKTLQSKYDHSPRVLGEYRLTKEEILKLFGCGQYALDAYQIFTRGKCECDSGDKVLRLFVTYKSG